MFWNHRARLEAVERELQDARQRESRLKAELAEAHDAAQRFETAHRQKDAECDVLRSVLRNLAQFSQSLSS